MKIESLANTDFDRLFTGFSRAFEKYEFRPDRRQFLTMLKRRGFRPDLSFAAFDGEDIVSFSLVCTGLFMGIPTAYNTGTGTVEEHRRKGLATEIINHSIPYLQKEGLRQYLLEVLIQNKAAYSVYRDLGFHTSRELIYSIQKNDEVRIHSENSGALIKASEVRREELLSVQGFADFHPSWQNSMEAISRMPDKFTYLGAFKDDLLAGCCIFQPDSGEVTQIAVDRRFRRKGIAAGLLRKVIELNPDGSVKFVNTDVACGSMNGFLNSVNITESGRQFEMIREL